MGESPSTFIVKVAGACNLNCTYCYMYNLGDTTYLMRPKRMSRKVALAALRRIRAYAVSRQFEAVSLVIHGGEPLLVGKDWMKWFLAEARRESTPNLEIGFALQTNGTLLDHEWIKLLKTHDVPIGISIDGPADWHDRFRISLAGRGTYAQVRRAIDLLVQMGAEAPRWGVLVVANPDYSGVSIYNHLLEIGVRNMDFLWPDFHHDMKPPWPSGTLSQYYMDLFDNWYGAGDASVKIRWFEAILQMLLGAATPIDALGPQALTEVVVESDGSLEPLDVLRTCANGMTRQGLNVLANTVTDLYATELFQTGVRNQELLPKQCHRCPVYKICGGGYLPHRWSRGNGFANPSVHCLDLLAVIQHITRRIQSELHAAAAMSNQKAVSESSSILSICV